MYTRVLIIAILILSTAFHEMAHAFTATWLGDPTPGRNGRLTLNPIPHLQPILTAIILPLMMFLSGNGFMILAQTPIDPSRFKHPLRDHALVAIAGPLTNIVCAFILIGVRWIPGMQNQDEPHASMFALECAAYFNFVLAIFNLFPLPPLDGYWIVRSILPLGIRRMADDFSRNQFSLIICLLVGSRLVSLFKPFLKVLMHALLPNGGLLF